MELRGSFTIVHNVDKLEKEKYESLDELLLKAQELLGSYSSKSPGIYGQLWFTLLKNSKITKKYKSLEESLVKYCSKLVGSYSSQC